MFSKINCQLKRNLRGLWFLSNNYPKYSNNYPKYKKLGVSNKPSTLGLLEAQMEMGRMARGTEIQLRRMGKRQAQIRSNTSGPAMSQDMPKIMGKSKLKVHYCKERRIVNLGKPSTQLGQ